MKLVKVAAAALNQTPLAWDHNRHNIVSALARARIEGVGILCLPEMCITGYGCEDAFHSPSVQKTALEILAELARHTTGMVVSLGLPLYHRKALYNAACLAVDGRIVGFVAKRFLAGDGVHYEPRWFKPWPGGHRSHVELAGEEVPLGDLFFDCSGVRIGFEICEDAWVANRPGSDLSLRGVDLILNPSASHFAFDKSSVRQRFVVEGSRAFGVAYVYANLLGNEAGRIIYDGGALIASGGALIASGPRFSFADFELTCAVVDIDENRVEQVRRGSHRPLYDDSDIGCVEVAFPIPEPEVGAVAGAPLSSTASPRLGNRPEPGSARPATSPAEPDDDGGWIRATSWENGPFVAEEEFARAVALGLFDYLRKCRAHGFVVSLSGGADSAAVAVLVALAVELAVDQIGVEAVRLRLGHIPDLDRAQTEVEVIHRLLLCVYQATRNSSDTTYNAARAVAEAIGAEFIRLDIDSMVDGYVAMAAAAMGRQLDWQRDDIALQNIQARARGPSVWMLANLRNALLLATSNRSEAAVGYATMDGDTCGGLSPIAGIDKAFLRRWLTWMEEIGPGGERGLPGLRAVNQQQPTAELRPPEAEQTDEGDLMPYPLLDAIESAAIGKKQSPIEVFHHLRGAFRQYSVVQLGEWINRFFRLWCRNQWKRERYAPSFHVDDKNLDPKTWCRFPILSGGFERELAELAELVAELVKEA